MQIHHISGGGLRLHVREWGRADGPAILFVHGWSQCHLCWQRQYESTLAGSFRLVAFDCRGHGMSDAPLEPEYYTSSQSWADDVHEIIDQLGLNRPVLVGSSYGGYVICDYLRHYGDGRISGMNFAGGAVVLNEAAFGTLIGPGFLDHFPGAIADDLPTNIETIRSFVRACVARPLPQEVLENALCWNMVVPAKVRAALLMREIQNDDVLGRLTVPVLLSHGTADTVVLPAMAEHTLAACPTATVSWYDGVGHLPFAEEAERFNTELADFAARNGSIIRPAAE
jgi:pimeloyl-ACP methyl ester carboxylesterase